MSTLTKTISRIGIDWKALSDLSDRGKTFSKSRTALKSPGKLAQSGDTFKINGRWPHAQGVEKGAEHLRNSIE